MLILSPFVGTVFLCEVRSYHTPPLSKCNGLSNSRLFGSMTAPLRGGVKVVASSATRRRGGDTKVLRIESLRDHLMVGYMTLNHVILVRIQVPQPSFGIRIFAKNRSVAKRRDWSFREIPPRVFEIQKERAEREAGVRANLFKKISFGFEIFFGSDNYGLVTV